LTLLGGAAVARQLIGSHMVGAGEQAALRRRHVAASIAMQTIELIATMLAAMSV
jgi:hypothetical protein